METSKLVSIARRQDADAEKVAPNNMALQILETNKIMSDGSGGSYLYNGAYWKEVSNETLLAMAKKVDTDRHTSNNRRKETVSFLRSHHHLEEIGWRNIKPTEIPFANGVFDIDTETLRQHDPDDRLDTVLPHDWKVGPADCPLWLEALAVYWGKDPDFAEKCSALQEFMGYCLMPHAKYKKALVLQGPSDSGKSLIADVIERMVGQRNCCCLSVQDMDDATERTALIGKMVNKVTELTSRAIVADGGFKTLVSTEESIGMRLLYRNPFMYTPIAKHVFVCNELPTVNDRSEGTYNRMLILRFKRILGKLEQDRGIVEKIAAEVEAICHWALIGAHRLYLNGGMFTEVPDAVAALNEYRASQNEMMDFVSEKCEIDADSSVLFSELFEKFLGWVKGGKHTRHSVGRMLKAAGYAVKDEWDGYGKRSRKCVQGLRWQVGA